MKSVMTIVFIVVLALSLYQLFDGYIRSKGVTVWQKLRDTFYDSATLAVAFVVRLLDALAGSAEGLSFWFNMPEAQAVIAKFLTPENAMLLMLVVAVVTELARRRRGSALRVS